MAYTGNLQFNGYDARRAASDGAIRDMQNMSHRFYPAIASRVARQHVGDWGSDFGGAYFGDSDFTVHDGGFYDGDQRVCDLTPGRKQIAALENEIYIIPDKIRYNTKTKTVRNFSVIVTNKNEVTTKPIYIDYYYDKENVGDFINVTYYASGVAFPKSTFTEFNFTAGDIVQLKITRIKRNGGWVDVNFELTIAPDDVRIENSNEKYGPVYVLKYPTDTFDEIVGTKGAYEVEVEVEYGMPDMDFIFMSENRLWGAKGREIYCSALGKGSVWMDYDVLATSAWAATTQMGDEITGACDFGGMPVFFSENAVYKIYGENPKEFQYARSNVIGVAAGEHASIAVGGGYVYYLSRRGVCAWTGGIPQVISDPIGNEKITDGVGGSDGVCYFISCFENGRRSLLRFDPSKMLWDREDDFYAAFMGMRGRDLCAVSVDGGAYLIGDVDGGEEDMRYMMETADYNDGAVVVKAAKHILLQHELTDGVADVCVSYDGEPWEHVYTLYDTDGKKITSVIPLREKRYRTMRIRIDGDGQLVIYYMVREVSAFTERTGGEKNVYQ